MSLAGVILCGGRSSRMGRPKAWLPIRETTFLDHLAGRLAEVCSPIVLVAAVGQALPPVRVPTVVVFDPVPDGGPLVGLSVGLRAAGKPAFVCGCDAPFIEPAFVRRLAELRGDALACIPLHDGRRHPLSAVYDATVADVADAMLAAGVSAVRAIADRVPTRFVTLTDAEFRSLQDADTPEEYHRLNGVDRA